MTVKRKGGRVSVSVKGGRVSAEGRATLESMLRNLTPDAQLQRMYKHLEIARLEGLSEDDYALYKAELDAGQPGHLDIVSDSLLAWRAKESRSHGGRKQSEGIRFAVMDMLDNDPDISNENAWKWFPDNANYPCVIETDQAEFEIYRDGKKLVQVNSTTRKENTVSRRSFEDYYLAPARKSRSM